MVFLTIKIIAILVIAACCLCAGWMARGLVDQASFDTADGLGKLLTKIKEMAL